MLGFSVSEIGNGDDQVVIAVNVHLIWKGIRVSNKLLPLDNRSRHRLDST